MLKQTIRGGILLVATAALLYGCSNNGGTPAGPHNFTRIARTTATPCGENAFLSELSPVLPVWADSIETWRGNSELLNATPEWTDQSTVDGYLAALIPVLQQWHDAINTSVGSAVLGPVPTFDPATQSRQAYLGELSTLIASWETALETQREKDFLPTAPVFKPDTIAPVIACIADTTINCADSLGAAVDFKVTATDDCDPAPKVTSVPPSGSLFPLGQTLVTCTAADTSGNTSTCTFTITVNAATPPVLKRVKAQPCVLWPPNHKMVNVRIKAKIDSPCGEDSTLTFKIVNVTSNEPDNGKGDGNTSPDWIITGDLTLQLRAERSGHGDGRVYSITVQLADSSGTIDERIVKVRVPHDMGHGGGNGDDQGDNDEGNHGHGGGNGNHGHHGRK